MQVHGHFYRLASVHPGFLTQEAAKDLDLSAYDNKDKFLTLPGN